MKKYFFYLTLPIMLLFYNCSREKSDWKNAKTLNNVQAYKQFISEHPKSVYTDSATFKFENINLGFFGTQSIRTNRFTGMKEIYGDKEWQSIIITTDGNVTIPKGTRIVTH